MAHSVHFPATAERIHLLNRVTRNTYALLAATLLFGAAMAGVAIVDRVAPLSPWLILIGCFGLLFATTAMRDSPWALALVFALTGFMGFTLGPLVSLYLALPSGAETVLLSLAGTGVVFLSLSGYALVSRRDFSFMTGFLMVGIIVAFLGGVAVLLFHLPLLSLVVASLFMLLMSGYILYQTRLLLQGGESSYVMATIGLFVSIRDHFLNLLQLLTAFGKQPLREE